ncbi:MAG: outer membrane protein assembly factor BamE [Maritimibacter sp.]
MSITGSMTGRAIRFVTVLLAIVTLSACSATYTNHGFVPTDEDVEELMVGLDTRETVAAIVGKPGAAGLLTEEAWYYVSSRFEHYAYKAPSEIDREVLSISFDDNGLVENIERFGLEKGQVVVLSRRVTTSNVAGVSFLRQLLGSVGKLNLEKILENN